MERARALHKQTRTTGAKNTLEGEQSALSALTRCCPSVVSALLPRSVVGRWSDIISMDRDMFMAMLHRSSQQMIDLGVR